MVLPALYCRAEGGTAVSIQHEIPRSRLTLTYRTTINGEPETINLPFRLLVLGDFSSGKSKDCQKDLETRPLRAINGTNVNSVMREMGITLELEGVDNCIDEGNGKLGVTLPLESMRSFSPDEIVKHVPKLKALLLIRRLIQELQGQIDNQSELRKAIQALFSDKKNLESLKQELRPFANLQLPARAKAETSLQNQSKA